MCTSIIVGKKATKDNIIILGRNEDYTCNNWDKFMTYRKEPAYYNSGDNIAVSEGLWTLGNGLKVKVPSKMYSYSAMPDAEGYKEAAFSIGDRFFFEERGINECNVAISATNSMETNSKAAAADPFPLVGIEEAIIVTLILPQAESAIEAVNLLGEYVEKYGASESNGILIGDEREVWYFEIGSAHKWIAVKVPEESYIIVSNSMRIHNVNLNDIENVKYSAGIYEFVEENKLLTEEELEKENFNFAKAFGVLGNPYNVDRLWLAQNILTPSIRQEIRKEQYPMFMKPDKKVEVKDIMNLFRANYVGTELENIGYRPIGVDRTAESHIMTLDDEMDKELKGVIWQAVGTPLGAPYFPLYNVTNPIPESFFIGGSKYNPSSAYWAFRGLFALGSICGTENKFNYKNLWGKYEEKFLQEQKYIKSTLKKMCESSRELAIDFAINYSTGIIDDLIAIAEQEQNKFMTDITINQKDDFERLNI